MQALLDLIAELQAVEASLEANPNDATVKGRLEQASDDLLDIIHSIHSTTPTTGDPDDNTDKPVV